MNDILEESKIFKISISKYMNVINSKIPKKGFKKKHSKKEINNFDESSERSKIQKPTKLGKRKINEKTKSDSYTITISLQRGYQPFIISHLVSYDLTIGSEINEVETESPASLYRLFCNSCFTGKCVKCIMKQKP